MPGFGHPYYPSEGDHTRREAVPGPYHAVKRGDFDHHAIIVRAIIEELRKPDPMFMAENAIAAIEHVLDAYTNDLHVSGALDRVYSNDATVRAAVDALNK